MSRGKAAAALSAQLHSQIASSLSPATAHNAQQNPSNEASEALLVTSPPPNSSSQASMIASTTPVVSIPGKSICAPSGLFFQHFYLTSAIVFAAAKPSVPVAVARPVAVTVENYYSSRIIKSAHSFRILSEIPQVLLVMLHHFPRIAPKFVPTLAPVMVTAMSSAVMPSALDDRVETTSPYQKRQRDIILAQVRY